MDAPKRPSPKRRKRNLIRAAEAYLYERKLDGAPCRFDVVTILLHHDAAPQIEHFEHAFWRR